MRDLGSPMIGGLISNAVEVFVALDLTLTSSVEHVWSGRGDITFGGNTYRGVGSLGTIGDVTEGTEVKADGTSVTLSGIDPALLNESLNDIRLGAPATIWFGLLSSGAVLGAPYPLFVGTVDKPAVAVGAEKIAITLNLENRMFDLQRATNRRYTAADQRYYYSDDIGFNWVETLNDIALRWGS